MIELDLKKLAAELIWQLEVLAVVRATCGRHDINSTWCAEQEQRVAELLGTLRRIMTVRGDVMQIRETG